MENDSFFLKLSKNKLAFILILIVLISSLVANSYLNSYILSEFYPDFVIEANELDEKPSEFFPSSELDSYGIQAIFNSSTGVEVSLDVFNRILKLVDRHGTRNVEYDSNYYRLEFDLEDDNVQAIPSSFIVLSFIISAISTISVILIVIIVIIKILDILARAFLWK